MDNKLREIKQLTPLQKAEIESYIQMPTETGFMVHAEPAKRCIEQLYQMVLERDDTIKRLTAENKQLKLRYLEEFEKKHD